MAQFTEVFNRWDKGDWGTLGRRRAGQLEDGFFKAKNLIVHPDNSIGPRLGLRTFSHTGVPNGNVLLAGYLGEFGQATQERFFVIGNTLYVAPSATNGATRTIGTLSGGTPTGLAHASYVTVNNDAMFAVPGSGVYYWNRASDSLTQVSPDSSLAWNSMVLHRDRVYASTFGYRLYFSDPADFTTWGVGSYLDVGYESGVVAIGQVGNNLHIYTERGEWAMSGVPESSSTLREVLPSTYAPGSNNVVAAKDLGGAWWIPSERNAPAWSRAGLLDRASYEHLEDWATGSVHSSVICGAYDYGSGDVLFIDDAGNGLLRHNSVWTYQVFSTGTSGIVHPMGGSVFGLVKDGTASTPPVFYGYRAELSEGRIHRPGFVSDTGAQPGDASTTPLDAYLYLPEKWHPQGKEMQVEQVEVRFVTFNTGTAETAHFDVVVEATSPTRVDGTASVGGNTSGVQSFDEAVSSSSTSGTEQVMRFNVGDQGWGRGYQIRFDNIRSLNIREVSAIGVRDEPREGRG